MKTWTHSSKIPQNCTYLYPIFKNVGIATLAEVNYLNTPFTMCCSNSSEMCTIQVSNAMCGFQCGFQ